MAQCAKYRLFQEGHPRLQHTCTLSHTTHLQLSRDFKLFVFARPLEIYLWKPMAGSQVSLVDLVSGYDYTSVTLHPYARVKHHQWPLQYTSNSKVGTVLWNHCQAYSKVPKCVIVLPISIR